MSTILNKVKNAGTKVMAAQADLAKTAATLEAARILGDEVTALAKKHAPIFVRGYMDEPYAKAVLMNAVLVAIETGFPELPSDHVYKQVANAAVVVSYQQFIQTFNIQDIVKDLFGGEKMGKALKNLKKVEA